jgi:hypothetical protein
MNVNKPLSISLTFLGVLHVITVREYPITNSTSPLLQPTVEPAYKDVLWS